MAKPLTVGDILNCRECEAEYMRCPETLIAACASVGIEHGKSTTQMLREYLAAHHLGGHRRTR